LSGVDPATSLAFGSGGSLLAVGSATGSVTLWDVADASRPAELAGLARHTGAVAGIAVHPDGSLLASAGDDGSIRLTSITDPARPVELATLDDGGRPGGAQIGFSPDGSILVTASSESAAVWDVDPRRLAGRLCADSTPITAADWARYLPDLPYEPPCR
jgi:WD40 repeat protein